MTKDSNRRSSSYHYIDGITKDFNRTKEDSYIQSRTPIDQSFIRKINSTESSHLL